MGIEWKLKEWPGHKLYPEQTSYNPKFAWVLEGELRMSLVLNPSCLRGERPFFEMAQIIEGSAVQYLVPLHNLMSPYLLEYHLVHPGEFIETDPVVDVLWLGESLEELEEYCRRRRLPSPQEAEQAYGFISNPANIEQQITYLPGN